VIFKDHDRTCPEEDGNDTGNNDTPAKGEKSARLCIHGAKRTQSSFQSQLASLYLAECVPCSRKTMLRRLLLLMLLSSTPLLAQSYYDFREGFLDRKGKITRMDLVPVEESATTITFDFRLESSTEDSITGRIRFPKGTGPFPTALLAVGIETGKEVIAMIEGQDDVLLMAVDYPFEGEWDFRGWAAFGTAWRLRKMGFRTVPLLLNCIDWLSEQKEVDRNDLALITVSFGAFTGIPAAVIDERVSRLVVVQSGGDVPLVVAHNSKKWGATMPPWLAGWLGGALLAPFEPLKYIAHLSPRPLLMIVGTGDSFFPPESSERLFNRAGEPKEIIHHHSDHVMPGEKEMIRELTNVVARKMYGSNKTRR
jgi:hypothetical protein